MLDRLRNLAKSLVLPLRAVHKLAPATQIAQLNLYHRYRTFRGRAGAPGLSEVGFRVFSQHEEDGILLYLFALLGMDNPTFVDVGSNDGVNSNCANLLVHFNWRGLFLDADAAAIARGRRFYRRHPDPWSYKPTFRRAFVTAENINDLVTEAGFAGEIGLLSVDLDGNDYWVWRALEAATPRVVVVEAHLEFGLRNVVVPYDPDYAPPGAHPLYHGASPVALAALGKAKGYRLVGANHLGHNLFFVREDVCPDNLPEVSVESTLKHPNFSAGDRYWDELKHLPFERG